MEVEKILDVMKNNKNILNSYYTGENCFDVSEEGEIISLFFFTKDQKEDNKKIEKIRELFGASSCMYVEKEEDNPAFYTLDFIRRKI